jgi:SAM-dependent methyltransferase
VTGPADSFGAFEHAGWQQVATRYDGIFGQLTTQCIEPMLDSVGAGRGMAVLDVATGPGYLAAAAASRGAIVTAVDFSSSMVELARSRHPQVRFQEANAESLPFPDAIFDAVTIGFGLLHFPNPDKALAEACRVLREGGRLAFTAWAGADKAVGFGLVAKAVQAHGIPGVGLPDGPPFFRFSDPLECGRTLSGLGCVDIRSSEVAQTWRFPSAEAWIEGVSRSTVRTAAVLRAQSEEAMARIRAALIEAASAHRGDDGTIALPMPAVLTSGRKS